MSQPPATAALRRFLTSQRVSLVLCYVLGVMILVSAVPKLIDIETNSVYVVYSYYILPVQPVNIARIAGLAIPYVELAIGIGLVVGVLTRVSAIGWMVLSLAYFSIKIDLVFVQGRIVPCGCFGGLLPNLLVTQSIWIDLASILFCVQIALARKGRPSPLHVDVHAPSV